MAPAVEPTALEEVQVINLVVPSIPRPRGRPQEFPDPMRSPAAGVLAIVGLVAASIVLLAGGQLPVALVIMSLLQLGRSGDWMAKAYRDWRDWRGSGVNRPRFLPPVPPAAA
jgi:hypothetical protein